MSKLSAQQKAIEIYKNFNSNNQSPFPFERLISNCPDLKIFYTALPSGISGAILFDAEDNKFNILIDTNLPQTRQYFTIAHELGHYYLHQDEVRQNENLIVDKEGFDQVKALFRLNDAETTQIEIEANHFAANLLMPEDLIQKAWNDLRDISAIANIFKVSQIAMRFRLENLGILTEDYNGK